MPCSSDAPYQLFIWMIYLNDPSIVRYCFSHWWHSCCAWHQATSSWDTNQSPVITTTWYEKDIITNHLQIYKTQHLYRLLGISIDCWVHPWANQKLSMWWKWGEGRDKRQASMVQWKVASKGIGNGRMMTWQSAQCLEWQSDTTECRGMNVTNSETYSSTSNYISREAQLRRNVYWPRPSVCLSVCPLPHFHTTAQTQTRM